MLIPQSVVQGNSGYVFTMEQQLTEAAANFDFTTIPPSANHLVVKLYARASPAAASQNPQMRFNGDTGTNYDFHLAAIGSTLGVADSNAGSSFIRVGSVPAANAPANSFSLTVIEIGFYRASAHKACVYQQQLKLAESSGNLFTVPGSGMWRNTTPITRVTIALDSGNFVSGSWAILYGLR